MDSGLEAPGPTACSSGPARGLPLATWSKQSLAIGRIRYTEPGEVSPNKWAKLSVSPTVGYP
jgi:hypothetical protein